MKWTTEGDRRLLLAVIAVLSPSPPNWESVVNLMGNDVTIESARQHYQKLRKITNMTAGVDTEANSPEASTPKKRKGKAQEGQDGLASDETPSKRKKSEPKSTKEPKVKTEPKVEEGDSAI